MGNRITVHTHSDCGDLPLSNGAMSAMVHVLVIEGALLATTEREKDLMTWLASLNQSVVGSGTVGFDLADIPWSKEGFTVEKGFLIRVIDAAKSREHWNELDPQPTTAMLREHLTRLKHMLSPLQPTEITAASLMEWASLRPKAFEKCPEHGVYMMSWGEEPVCILCTDQ